jgi:hypothetical protein
MTKLVFLLNCSFGYCPRECNWVVHALAALGCKSPQGAAKCGMVRRLVLRTWWLVISLSS